MLFVIVQKKPSKRQKLQKMSKIRQPWNGQKKEQHKEIIQKIDNFLLNLKKILGRSVKNSKFSLKQITDWNCYG